MNTETQRAETHEEHRRRGDLPCWLDEHGWGDAGYMDDPDEQASECALLRERSVAGVSDAIPYCRRHGFHEETARPMERVNK